MRLPARPELSPRFDPLVLGRRVGARSRRSLSDRLGRLRRRGFFIVQCAVSAAISWFIAREILGEAQPFFAPVAALVALGFSFGHRIERVVQIVLGVAVGVFVGDAVVAFLGSGYWQFVLIIVAAMSLTTLLDAGVLTTTQAGVQAAIVTILVAAPGQAFSRWTDAVLGGGVALLAATITPASPLRRPRQHTSTIVAGLGSVLTDAANAMRAGDLELAEAALTRARAADEQLATLRELLEDGLAVIRSSPFRRGHLPAVQVIADLAVPLDRALGSARGVIRRAASSIRRGERVPKSYIDLVADLGGVATDMADELERRHLPTHARAPLADIAERTVYVTSRPTLSSEVLRGQVRATVLDLLMVTGLRHDEAFRYIPASYSLDGHDDELHDLDDEPDEDDPRDDDRGRDGG